MIVSALAQPDIARDPRSCADGLCRQGKRLGGFWGSPLLCGTLRSYEGSNQTHRVARQTDVVFGGRGCGGGGVVRVYGGSYAVWWFTLRPTIDRPITTTPGVHERAGVGSPQATAEAAVDG